MLYEVKIRLTMPWLGAQKTTEQIRRFKLSKDKKELDLDRELWDWAYRQAIASLHFDDIDSTTIRSSMSIKSPTVALHTRKYKNKAGKQQQELFECIVKNTVITIPVMVATNPEDMNDKRSPTKKELETMFEFIGEFVGLSPWGSKFGYGTFKLISITEK